MTETFAEMWAEAREQHKPGGIGWEFDRCKKLYSQHLKNLGGKRVD